MDNHLTIKPKKLTKSNQINLGKSYEVTNLKY